VGVKDSIFAKWVTNPFAGHGHCHEWNVVAHSAREFKHDNHQSVVRVTDTIFDE